MALRISYLSERLTDTYEHLLELINFLFVVLFKFLIMTYKERVLLASNYFPLITVLLLSFHIFSFRPEDAAGAAWMLM